MSALVNDIQPRQGPLTSVRGEPLLDQTCKTKIIIIKKNHTQTPKFYIYIYIIKMKNLLKIPLGFFRGRYQRQSPHFRFFLQRNVKTYASPPYTIMCHLCIKNKVDKAFMSQCFPNQVTKLWSIRKDCLKLKAFKQNTTKISGLLSKQKFLYNNLKWLKKRFFL